MKLSQEAIDEYKKIFKKEFHRDLSNAEAIEQGTRLLRLLQIIYRPIPKEDKQENVQK